MKMEKMSKITLFLLSFSFLSMSSAYAAETIINNYATPAAAAPAPAPAAASSPCNSATNYNQTQSSYGTNTPPGTYTIKHGDGSSETVYTTGDKKPYLVDNGCNNSSSPVIQPYINVPPPYAGGDDKTHPRPGPLPRR